MNLAGKYLSLAQGVAESALLAPLRSKYKLPLNLENLATEAKQYLAEQGLPINPASLRAAADDIASMQSTQLEDVVGLTDERWNPALRDYEEYTIPDPRKYFIR